MESDSGETAAGVSRGEEMEIGQQRIGEGTRGRGRGGGGGGGGGRGIDGFKAQGAYFLFWWAGRGTRIDVRCLM